MNEPGEISVARVIDLCRERDVRLAYEIGAFVVFEACEAVLAKPRAIRAGDVWVSPEGTTRVTAGTAAEDAGAAGALAELLAAVLVVAGQEVPGMLMHLVDVPRAKQLGLGGYRDELEAALVPLNRAAARRVLARQLRELTRPKGARPAEGEGGGAPDAAAADADLDALLGYEAPPAPELPEPTPQPTEAPLGAAAEQPAAPTAADRVRGVREPTASATLAGPSQVHVPLGLPREPDLDGVLEKRDAGRSRGPSLAMVAVVALVVGLGAFLWLTGRL